MVGPVLVAPDRQAAERVVVHGRVDAADGPLLSARDAEAHGAPRVHVGPDALARRAPRLVRVEQRAARRGDGRGQAVAADEDPVLGAPLLAQDVQQPPRDGRERGHAGRRDGVGPERLRRRGDERLDERGRRAARLRGAHEPVWKSNLQPDFNVRVIELIAPYSSAVLRELDESNRFVQKSAESTSI